MKMCFRCAAVLAHFYSILPRMSTLVRYSSALFVGISAVQWPDWGPPCWLTDLQCRLRVSRALPSGRNGIDEPAAQRHHSASHLVCLQEKSAVVEKQEGNGTVSHGTTSGDGRTFGTTLVIG